MSSDLIGFIKREGMGLPPLGLHSLNCKSLDLCLRRSEGRNAKEPHGKFETRTAVPNVAPHAATEGKKLTCVKCGSQFLEKSRFCPGCGVFLEAVGEAKRKIRLGRLRELSGG